MAKKEFFEELDDLELSATDLAGLVTDDGKEINPELGRSAQLARAEREQLPEDYRRSKSLTTGHKIRILGDFKAGATQTELCRKHKITPTTLTVILNDESLQEICNSTNINHTKKLLASRFYQMADMALNFITPEKLHKLNPYQLGMLAAVSLDKARLLEGESTQNITFRSLTMNVHAQLEQLKERKKVLMDAIAERSGTISHQPTQ